MIVILDGTERHRYEGQGVETGEVPRRDVQAVEALVEDATRCEGNVVGAVAIRTSKPDDVRGHGQ